MDIDFTKRPVGTYFGGEHPRSVACPRCGLPGLFLGQQRRQVGKDKRPVSVYVHQATMQLGPTNEPELTYGPECWAGAGLSDGKVKEP